MIREFSLRTKVSVTLRGRFVAGGIHDYEFSCSRVGGTTGRCSRGGIVLVINGRSITCRGDLRKLNRFENHSAVARRHSLVGSGAHLVGVRIHGSIGHRISIVLRELRALRRPLLRVVPGEREARKLILKHLDHGSESRVLSRRNLGERALRLLALAVDTKLQRGIKVASIDSRTTTRGTLGRIQLALQALPGGFLGGKQRKTTGRPSVSAPIRSVVMSLLNLVLGCQFGSLRRTHGRRFILRKAVVGDVEDLLLIHHRTQCAHIRSHRFRCALKEEDVDVVSIDFDVQEFVLNHHDKQENDQRHHNAGGKQGSRNESHANDDDHQCSHANGDGCIQRNHLLSKGHTNYERA